VSDEKKAPTLEERLKLMEERMTRQLEERDSRYQQDIERLKQENEQLRRHSESLGTTSIQTRIPGAPRISRPDVIAFCKRRLPDTLFFTINRPMYRQVIFPGERRQSQFQEGRQTVGEPLIMEMRPFHGPGSDLKDPKPFRSDLIYLRIGHCNVAENPLVRITKEELAELHLMDEATPEEIERFLVAHKNAPYAIKDVLTKVRADDDFRMGKVLDARRYQVEIHSRYSSLWAIQDIEKKRQVSMDDLSAGDSWKAGGMLLDPLTVVPE